MFLLDNMLLASLSFEARESVRGRKNYNIHSSHQEFCQRFINVICKGSYIRPHRHIASGRNELLVALKGRFSLITFDDHGNFIDTFCFGSERYMDTSCSNVGLEITPHVWHTVIAHEEYCAVLEVKEGPFVAPISKELAEWAPVEGSNEADKFLADCYKFASSFS